MPDSDLGQFTESVTRLKMLGVNLHMVCVSHFGRAVVQPWILDEVAEAFAHIKRGAVTFRASQDALRRPVSEMQFPNFSILLPPDPRAVESLASALCLGDQTIDRMELKNQRPVARRLLR